MKCKQPCTGFELESTSPFLTTITVALHGISDDDDSLGALVITAVEVDNFVVGGDAVAAVVFLWLSLLVLLLLLLWLFSELSNDVMFAAIFTALLLSFCCFCFFNAKKKEK